MGTKRFFWGAQAQGAGAFPAAASPPRRHDRRRGGVGPRAGGRAGRYGRASLKPCGLWGLGAFSWPWPSVLGLGVCALAAPPRAAAVAAPPPSPPSLPLPAARPCSCCGWPPRPPRGSATSQIAPGEGGTCTDAWGRGARVGGEGGGGGARGGREKKRKTRRAADCLYLVYTACPPVPSLSATPSRRAAPPRKQHLSHAPDPAVGRRRGARARRARRGRAREREAFCPRPALRVQPSSSRLVRSSSPPPLAPLLEAARPLSLGIYTTITQ